MRSWGFVVAVLAVAASPWLFVACGTSGRSSTNTVPDGSVGGADHEARDGGSVILGEAGDDAPRDAGLEAALDAAPIPLGDLCPLFTQDLCIYLMQCNHALYRDLAHCEAELDCYGLPQLQMAAAEGGVIYDPRQVGACHARFLTDPCGFGFFLFTPDIFEVLSFCPGTITPQLTAGAFCVSSGECVQGLYCKKDSGCPGVCIPFAKVGESCAGSAQCDPKLVCTSVTTGPLPYVCKAPPTANSPCSGNCGSTENCPTSPSLCSKPNLWCDTTSGTCKPGVGEGAACGPPDDGGLLSGSIACANSLWCDQVFLDQPGTCRTAGGVGSPCNELGCNGGLHCAGYVPLGAAATLGTCVGPSADGGPCKTSSDCQGGTYCGNDTCGGGLPYGAMCTQDTDCQAGLTCSASMCVHAAYPGDTCDGTTSVCVYSLCRNGTCVDHAKVGQPCMVGTDCTTGTCYQGTCADTSVCPVP
jgi:hypothetical protein